MIGRERAVASSRLDPRSVQGCRLGTGVHGDGGAILRGEPQLIEGVNGDQLVARRNPRRERVHADAHLLVGGGLREPIGRKVLLESRRGTVERHRLNRGIVSEPGSRLVTLGCRHVPEGDGGDGDDDGKRDENDRGERASEALTRVARGDAEYHSPSPHSRAHSAHQFPGAVSASRSLSVSPRDRSTMRPSRRKTVRSAHAAIRAS